MIDTIKIWVPSILIQDKTCFQRIESKLSNLGDPFEKNGIEYRNGNFRNLRVSLAPNRIKIQGSLAKFYFGTNTKTLRRSDIQNAIEDMGECLLPEVQMGDVRRLDLAENILLKYDPLAYFPKLGVLKGFARLVQQDSIQYQNWQREFHFYDKKKVCKKYKVQIPDHWKDANILRPEFRIMKEVPKYFKRKELKVKNLYEPSFYKQFVDEYLRQYERITKIQTIKGFADLAIKKPKDFFAQFTILKLKEIGAEAAFHKVDELKAMNIFKSPEYYSRVKKDLKTYYTSPEYTEQCDLITELNDKVRSLKTRIE